MKKSLKILIFIMAFAFVGILNVKAAGTNCSDPFENMSKYDWEKNGSVYPVTGSATVTDEPTCSTSGETYTQVVRNMNGLECEDYADASGNCHTEQKWKRTYKEVEPQDPTFSLDRNSLVRITKPNSDTLRVTQKVGCASVTWSKQGQITINGSGDSVTINTNNVTSSGSSNSVTATCHGAEGYKATTSITVSVVVTVPQTSDVLTKIDPASTTKHLSPGAPGEVTFSAQNADSQALTVTWSVSDPNGLVSSNGCTGTKGNCSIQITAKKCDIDKTITVTATDTHGNEKSSTVTVVSYDDWSSDLGPVDLPASTTVYTRESAKQNKTCWAYEDSSNNPDGSVHYLHHYNRCCNGTPTPPPPSDTDACYKCGEELKWGKYASDTSCTFISTDSNDCAEQPYCYKNVDTGEYDFDKHANDAKWVKISENEADCQKEPEPEDPACYSKGNDYVWGKYKDVPGYTLTSLTEAQCKKFCYKEKATGNYTWGNHVGDDKYEIVASITDQTKCKAACYKCGNDVKWGPYADDSKCEEVPGVTTVDDCKVTPPPTGLSVSNILYACGAFLVIMGSGIVVYQLTRVKKEFN